MNTFIPTDNIFDCPKYLDKRRCFKQLLESYQILNILDGKSTGYKNHPVIRMYEDNRDFLQWYYNIFYEYCVNVHMINIKKLPPPSLLPQMMIYPIWWGYYPLHKSHLQNLKRKSIEEYEKHNTTNLANILISQIYGNYDNLEWKNIPYIWPVDKDGYLIQEIREWYFKLALEK